MMFSVDSKKKVKERADHSKCLSLDQDRKCCSLREITMLNNNINEMWLYISCRIKKFLNKIKMYLHLQDI